MHEKVVAWNFHAWKWKFCPQNFLGWFFRPRIFFIGNWVVHYLIHGIHLRGNIFIFMRGSFIFKHGSFISMHEKEIFMPQFFHAWTFSRDIHIYQFMIGAGKPRYGCSRRLRHWHWQSQSQPQAKKSLAEFYCQLMEQRLRKRGFCQIPHTFRGLWLVEGSQMWYK